MIIQLKGIKPPQIPLTPGNVPGTKRVRIKEGEEFPLDVKGNTEEKGMKGKTKPSSCG